MKTCSKCGLDKDPVADFGVDRSQASGRRPYCKSCESKRVSAYRLRNPGRVARTDRNKHLKKKYGLSQGAFDALLADQGGVCKICKTDQPGLLGFHVDHDHVTGRVRGLLCTGCNTGLGCFKERISALEAAIEYLKERSNAAA